MTTQKLNCKVGDLAVTVKCEIFQNLGKIVRIEQPVGYKKWRSFGQVFLWRVSVPENAAEGLVYDFDGWVEERNEGEVPDMFLRPISGDSSKAEEMAGTGVKRLPQKIGQKLGATSNVEH